MATPTTTDLSTLLMIDSAPARDRDDAFAVTPLAGARGWAVEVHIAGVADVVELGSVADELADGARGADVRDSGGVRGHHTSPKRGTCVTPLPLPAVGHRWVDSSTGWSTGLAS